MKKEKEAKTKQGDISIGVRPVTFLLAFDTEWVRLSR